MDNTTVQQLIFTIIFGMIMGGITAFFAERRGRSPTIWFFVGFLAGIFGLLLLFILPQYSKEASKTVPPKSDVTIAPAVPPAASPVVGEKLWYYLDRQQIQCGPVPYSHIKALLDKQELTPATYVWSEGMPSWKTIKEL